MVDVSCYVISKICIRECVKKTNIITLKFTISCETVRYSLTRTRFKRMLDEFILYGPSLDPYRHHSTHVSDEFAQINQAG